MKKTENNKLIADFMGWKPTFKMLDVEPGWDIIMPVVEKIEGLGHGVTIYKKGCHINNEAAFTTNGFNHSSKIEQTYKAVVEFIKWYNENK